MPAKFSFVLITIMALGSIGSGAPKVKPVAETPVLTSKTKPQLVSLDADISGAKELHLVVSDEGSNSCDWVDWISPELVMADGSIRDLTELKWQAAKTGYGKIHLLRYVP